MAPSIICSKCGKLTPSAQSSCSSSRPPKAREVSVYDVKDVKRAATVLKPCDTPLLGLSPSFMRNPRHRGTIFNVAYARDYHGKHAGTVQVVKLVRRSHDCRGGEEDHLLACIRTTRKAAEIVYAFLKAIDTKGWTILLNEPTVVRSDGSDREYREKERFALVEHYLPDLTKFNSNSGWSLESKRTHNRIMQALSHFSYVWSRGHMVLCNLQGAVNEKERRIVLTQPAIISRDGDVFGCADTGAKGLLTFLEWHSCNAFCSHMSMSRNQKVLFRPIENLERK